MNQVDLFWSFAIGSSFAAAASNQLKEEEDVFNNKYFVKTLLFLSLIFTPTFAYLGTQFPGWESMFALHSYLVNTGISPPGVRPPTAGLLMAGLTVLYLVAGISGFFFAFKFIKKGNMKAVHILWIAAYLLTAEMLLIGWDGTAFERLTYAGTWYEWDQWKLHGAANNYVWTDFFGSPTFKSIIAIGFFVLPPMAWIYYKWPRIRD